MSSYSPLGSNKYQNTHPFHLVDPSALPFVLSLSALGMAVSGVFYMHSEVYNNVNGFVMLIFFVLSTISLMFLWWLNVIYESYSGFHTVRVQKGLKIGFILFILSEVMFFFGFFWAFFHNSLSPAIEIGAIWPPLGIEPFDPTTFPLLKYFCTSFSGVSITYAHYYMMLKNIVIAREKAFLVTLALAVMFTYVQFDEFFYGPFRISDGIYGSCFYMITGLHGFHVIIGTLFILFVIFDIKPLRFSLIVVDHTLLFLYN